MFVKKLKNFFVLNKRKMDRWPIRHDVKCLVKRSGENEFESVYLGNFSSAGCGVFNRTCSLDVQKNVFVLFSAADSRQVEVSGKVVSQSVYYPAGNDSLKDAIYRFSISFDRHLNSSEIDLIKGSSQHFVPSQPG